MTAGALNTLVKAVRTGLVGQLVSCVPRPVQVHRAVSCNKNFKIFILLGCGCKSNCTALFKAPPPAPAPYTLQYFSTVCSRAPSSGKNAKWWLCSSLASSLAARARPAGAAPLSGYTYMYSKISVRWQSSVSGARARGPLGRAPNGDRAAILHLPSCGAAGP